MSVLLALGAAAVTAGIFFVSSGVPVTTDEVWFLQVLMRCRAGDVLYRDVFYGAGPLPVWLARWELRLGGARMLALRIASACYFVALLAAGSWVLCTLGAGTPVIVALWIVAVAFSGPTWGVDNHYGQVALLLTVLAAAGVAERATGGQLAWVVFAGAAAGGACASKQSTGAVAVLALGLVVALRSGGGWPDAAAFTTGVALALAACLGPLVRCGALRAYAVRAFRNKSTYVATARLGPLGGIRTLVHTRPRGSVVAAAGVTAAVSAFAILPLLAAAAAADGAALAGHAASVHRPAAMLGLALACVALAAAFPRADALHVHGLFPLGLLALFCTARAFAGATVPAPVATVGWAAAVVAASWTVVALAVSLDPWHRLALPPDVLDRDTRFFGGLRIVRRADTSIAEATRALRELTGGRVFLVRGDAALWYLEGELVNPTPFDYPFASTFGPSGQAATIARIGAGEIPWVCVGEPVDDRLEPAELRRFVSEQMEPVAPTPAGTLYRATPVGAAAAPADGEEARR